MREFLHDNKLIVLVVLALLVAGFLLRIFNVGHVLSYDEAWNANTMVSVAEGSVNDVFFNNYYRHPPLYNSVGVLVKLLTGADKQNLAVAMEIISILFSLALIFVIFLCGKEWFGLEAAVFSSVLFILMPATRVYDTFIKPESLTLLFCLLFIYFFFKTRYIVAGIFLGFAALSKEIFIFMPLALLVFLLVTWRKTRFRGFAISSGLAALMSFWWYIFLSNSKGEFTRFFLGRSQEALNWGKSWYYFIGRIPKDVGWVVLILVGMAGFLLAYEPLVSSKRHIFRDDNPNSMALFCVIWFLVVYLTISISYGKPPWMTYSALPAAALLGGWSLQEFLKLFERRREIGYSFVIVVLVLALVLSVIVGFGSFMETADPTFKGARNHKRVAEYINKNDGADATVLLRVNDFSPNLAFYLDLYKPGTVYEFPAVTTDAKDIPDPGKYKIFLLNRDTESGGAVTWIEKYPPGYFLARPGFPSPDGIDIAGLLAQYVEPVKIGNMWIFDGKSIMLKINEGRL